MPRGQVEGVGGLGLFHPFIDWFSFTQSEKHVNEKGIYFRIFSSDLLCNLIFPFSVNFQGNPNIFLAFGK